MFRRAAKGMWRWKSLVVVISMKKWLFQKLLEELEGMGFPKARATRALHYSGNVGLEDAVNWAVEHENDADIDQMLKGASSQEERRGREANGNGEKLL
ncbi:hypothetical protein CsSME_00047083 [Camellia sinensis var. sinensis]